MYVHYSHKKCLLFLTVILLIILPALGYGAEESITVTTYYPSPYGVYSEMRLYPKAPLPPASCSSSTEGTMYYDNVERTMKVCRCVNPPACSSFDYGWHPASSYWTLTGTYLSTNSPSWNVGIGTSSPGQKLVVQAADTASSTGIGATIYLQSDTSAAANRGGSVLFGDTGTTRAMIKGAYEGAGSSGYLAFSTKTSADVMTEALRINSSGNVGIGTGTTNPGTRLSVRVSGDGANAVLRLSSILSNWTAGFGPRLLFHGGSDDRVFGEIGSFLQNTGTGANAYMTFSTRNSEVLGERMRITSTGNVGIGTVAPTQVLDVTGGTGTAVAIFENTGPNYGEGGRLLLQNRNNNANSRVTYASIRSFTTNGTPGLESGDLVFNTARDGTLSEKARIDRYGNVGIGTSPVCKLDVSSSIGAVGGSVPLRLKSTAPETGTMLFQIGAQANTENTIVSLTLDELNSKDFTIAGWNLGNVGRIKLLANIVYTPGNVGIGSGMWSPSYQLQLSANSAAKPGSNTWTIVSDMRLKKNIKPLSGALDKMLKLKGRTFEWKEPETQGNYFGEIIGLIAQEVEEIFPNWININSQGYKDLTVAGFEALTVEAIRELKQENEALRVRLEELELKLKEN